MVFLNAEGLLDVGETRCPVTVSGNKRQRPDHLAAPFSYGPD